MTLSRTLYEVFFQDSTHYSQVVETPKGFEYRTQTGIPTLDLIQKHLDREEVLGAYTVNRGNFVRWMAFDIDSKLGIEKAREIAKKISEFLTTNKIPHVIEFSGSKGYHILIFFVDKTNAKRAKDFGERVRDFFGFNRTGKLHVEVYPKQEEIGDKEIGNLLRLPLGRHPVTFKEAKFVIVDQWEDGPSLDPEKCLAERTDIDALEASLLTLDNAQQIANTLAEYWESGQRHDITLCVSGMCVHAGWPEEKTKDLIERIHTLVPQGDLKDQLNAVKSTYERVAEGKTVLGENGLTTFIPSTILTSVRRLMGEVLTSQIVQTIDAIRLEKQAGFLKVRYVAQAVIAHCLENGRLVRDETHTFWLNKEDRQLILIGSYAWTRLLHNIMGLNVAESFGRQVAEAVEHSAWKAAKEVLVRKRSWWDKINKILYLNLGGPEIYILDGDVLNIKVVYNGEVDVLFRNSDDTMVLPNLLQEDNMIDPWKMLVDDVNFRDADATVSQQRQMLKAWICAMFFPEALPTRPILMVLGASGSGKTTTARRILWLIEGPKENVLGQVPDKPDALRASMAAHRMVVIDNIERTSVSWLPDTLNRAATGSQIELRELHTTNRVQKIVFNVFMCLTGTDIPFSEEAVYTRILPLELKHLDVYQSEASVQSNIENNFIPFWRGMLFELNKVVAELRAHPEMSVPSQTRLADFHTFCERIKKVDFIDADELMSGISNLVDSQKETLKQHSPFINILDGLIKTRADEMTSAMTCSELFARAQRYAAQQKQRFDWSNAQGLSRHLDMLEDQLKKHYGLVIKTDRVGGREVKKYLFGAAVAAVAAVKSATQAKAH